MTAAVSTRLFEPRFLLVGDQVQAGWGVLTRGDRIEAVGPVEQLRRDRPDAAIKVLPDMLLMPGTVNAHSHSFQSLLRGLGDDQVFAEWRTYLYGLTPTLDEEGVYVGALLAFGEMLLNGVTTVCDFFYLHHGTNDRDLAVVQAAHDLGIRLVLARTMMDSEAAPDAFRETPALAVANGRALAARLQGDSLASVIPAPHSVHRASGEMVQAGARLAAELATPWHIHVAEAQYEGIASREHYGLGPLALIASLGALDERIRIVHGVWLDDDEIASLGRAGGGLIHCAGSNLFLGDGIAPLPKYLDAGVTISVGCDSGSANNRVSIFSEMRLAATLQKGVATSSDVLKAPLALRMGTAHGAHASGQPVGALDAGNYADFVALDLNDLSLQPQHELVRNLIYSLESRAIRHVYVGGEAVVQDGRLARIDERSIVARVARVTASWHEGGLGREARL